MPPNQPSIATNPIPVQAVVCLPTKTCNVVSCPQCAKDFEPTNRRQRFCSPACRIAAHRAGKRKLDLQFQKERRSALGMSFDGRLNGAMRNVGRNRPKGYAERMAANNF